MRRIPIRILLIAAVVSLCLVGAMPASAASSPRVGDGAERPYTYTIWDESVAAPYAYLPEAVLTGASAGTTAFSSPTDLAVRDGEIYVLDAGNSRVVVLDEKGTFLREIASPADAPFTDARGISVADNGDILIARAEAGQVLVLSNEGELLKWYGRPVSEMIPDSVVYRPRLAIRGADGNVYVAAEGVYDGIVELDAEGNFLRFFGSNTVAAGLETFLSKLKDLVLTDAARRKTERILPAEYASMDMDAEGFFYTVTAKATASASQVKKHDPSGANILPKGTFGDIETSVAQGRVVTSTLSDIAVGRDGFFYVLDTERCKVFWYDASSDLLSVFGTSGTGRGAFTDPVALTVMGDKCLVLDRKSGTVTIFAPTAYGADLQKAVTLYNDDRYEESAALWEDLRRRNNNLEIVYEGIGKAAFGTGDHVAAMEAFRRAGDRENYDQAFRAYRSRQMQKWFPLVFALVVAALIALWIFISHQVKTADRRDERKHARRITPFYVMFHPADGYELIKSEKRGSALYATLVLAAVTFLRLVKLRYTAYLFNYTRVEDINFGFELGQVLLVFAVWVAAVWSIGTFLDGEGKVGELYTATGYALTPYALTTLLNVLVSQIVSLEEAAIYSLISGIGVLWTGILLFMTLIKIQRYSFKRALLSVVLSLLIILFLCFLFVLAYGLVGQFGSFLETVWKELTFRFQ